MGDSGATTTVGDGVTCGGAGATVTTGVVVVATAAAATSKTHTNLKNIFFFEAALLGSGGSASEKCGLC